MPDCIKWYKIIGTKVASSHLSDWLSMEKGRKLHKHCNNHVDEFLANMLTHLRLKSSLKPMLCGVHFIPCALTPLLHLSPGWLLHVKLCASKQPSSMQNWSSCWACLAYSMEWVLFWEPLRAVIYRSWCLLPGEAFSRVRWGTCCDGCECHIFILFLSRTAELWITVLATNLLQRRPISLEEISLIHPTSLQKEKKRCAEIWRRKLAELIKAQHQGRSSSGQCFGPAWLLRDPQLCWQWICIQVKDGTKVECSSVFILMFINKKGAKTSLVWQRTLVPVPEEIRWKRKTEGTKRYNVFCSLKHGYIDIQSYLKCIVWLK